jgi:hypothetical protein
MIGVGELEVIGIGVGEMTGVGLITRIPLSQISFFPDLIQVYFFPETVKVKPNLEQVDPGFVIAYARLIEEYKRITTVMTAIFNFFTRKIVLREKGFVFKTSRNRLNTLLTS